MLLKAKTFDEKNEMVEQFAFTQLKIGGPIGRDQLKARYLRESRTGASRIPAPPAPIWPKPDGRSVPGLRAFAR